MHLGINGKAAFVMGGSRGIGRAIAEELGHAGCRLVIAARGQAALDEAKTEMRRAGVDVTAIPGDLSDFDEIDRVIDIASDLIGPPEILVFNPPTPGTGSVMELQESDFALAFHQSVLCFMHMVKNVAPAMKAKSWGRVVTIGSMVTKQPARGQLGFDYARANVIRLAALAMSKTLAAELGGFGITMNTIATGSIDSESGASFLRDRATALGISPDEYRNAVFRSSVVGRIGTVQEMAALAAFLCSTRAAYTTGDNILCDGGLANSVF